MCRFRRPVSAGLWPCVSPVSTGHGETIVCAIEFGSSQQARCTLGYGNSTQTGSPHLEDQLPLMVRKTLHPVWLEKKDIEANLEKRESF